MSQARAEASSAADVDALVAEARAAVPDLVMQVVAEIRDQVPAYAGAENGERHRVIGLAVTGATNQFLDTLDGPAEPDPNVTKLFRDMGFGEAQEGHSLEPMRRSLRISTRHAWHLIHHLADAHGFDTSFLGRLGDSLLTYLDYLDHEVAHGHELGVRRRASAPSQIRDHLIDVLLSDPLDATEAPFELADAAEAAGWPLPGAVVVLRVSFHGTFPAEGLPDDVLIRAASSPALVIAPVAQAEAAAEMLSHAGPGLRIAMSPPLLPTQGAAADRWARRTLSLVDSGVIPPEPIIRCRDHATQLWLHAEPVLRSELTQELLAPLLAESPNSREILSETMLAWLESRDSAPAIAAKLNIHPQTVRYRWKRINELFGDLLHDPEYVVSVTMLLKATVPMWKAGDLSDVTDFKAAQGPE